MIQLDIRSRTETSDSTQKPLTPQPWFAVAYCMETKLLAKTPAVQVYISAVNMKRYCVACRKMLLKSLCKAQPIMSSEDSFSYLLFLYGGPREQQSWDSSKYLTVNSNLGYFCFHRTKQGRRCLSTWSAFPVGSARQDSSTFPDKRVTQVFVFGEMARDSVL